MPYDIKKQGNKYVVVKKDTGKVLGTHDSMQSAQRQIYAIRSNEAGNGS